MDFDCAIGLEVHAQLATQSKLFCSCSVQSSRPNQSICPICLGYPGVLPFLNQKAVEHAVRIALALNCAIPEQASFDRKHYFYPDLPKGYQITQHERPMGKLGTVMIETQAGVKSIRIIQVHLEEDAGKLGHGQGEDTCSYIDFNRAGIPLAEIVTAPDLSSIQEAVDCFRQLRILLRYLGVAECMMEMGGFRCDANISLRPQGSPTLGTKTEIKNINSFDFLAQALESEMMRQKSLLEAGEPVVQATVAWDEQSKRTVVMRTKEHAHDYRYLPEPDLGILNFEAKWLHLLKQALPELPHLRKKRLIAQYDFTPIEVDFLIQERARANYFEACSRLGADPKEILHWLQSIIQAYLHDQQQTMDQFPLKPQEFSELLRLLQSKKINHSMARNIFAQMIQTKKPASAFATKERITDRLVLLPLCEHILTQFPNIAQDFQKNPKAINMLLREMMRETQGQADAEIARQLFKDLLEAQQ